MATKKKKDPKNKAGLGLKIPVRRKRPKSSKKKSL